MKQTFIPRLAIAAGALPIGGGALAQVKIACIAPLPGPFANVGEAGLKGFREAAEVLVNQRDGLMGSRES